VANQERDQEGKSPVKAGYLFTGLMVAFFAATCATRIPVVTTPRYPDFVFPVVPSAYMDSAVAGENQNAWTFLQVGDLVEAEQRFAGLLGDNPDFYPAATGLGWVDIAQGEYDSAVVHFNQVVENHPTYVPALVGRGDAFLAVDSVEGALSSFEAALVEDPTLVRIVQIIAELRFTRMTKQLATARRAVEGGRLTDAELAYAEVIASSPDSAFLYLELAEVNRRQGEVEAALQQVQQAIALDTNDVNARVLEGDLYDVLGNLVAAEQAYMRADDVEPSDTTTARLRDVRDRLRLATLPEEYRAITNRGAVTRGDLAALLGVRLTDLLEEAAAGEQTVIITDTRNHWSNRWILEVTQAGIMQVDAGYRFEPDRNVRRGELADVIARVLGLVAQIDPVSARSWQAGRQRFTDMDTGHLSFGNAVQAVSAGVLSVLENETFQPSRVLSGEDAVEAVDRLGVIVREVG